MAEIFPTDTELAFSDLPRATEGPESSAIDLLWSGFETEKIDRNYYGIRERRTQTETAAKMDEIATAIYGRTLIDQLNTIDVGEPADQSQLAQQQWRAKYDKAYDELVIDMFDKLETAREFQPGEMANYPESMIDLEAQVQASVRNQLNAERNEAERVTNNRSDPNLAGGVAEFVGAAGAAVSDVEGLVTLPFGGPTANLGRRVLTGAIVGAGSEAATLPAYNGQADFLGRNRPNPFVQVGFGAAFGGALPLAGRGVELGVNAVTPAGRIRNQDLLTWGQREAATDLERGATTALARDMATQDTAPAGVNPSEHAAHLDDVQGALDADAPVMVRPSETVPNDVEGEAPGQTRQILDFVRQLEGPQGYDTVYNGIRAEDRPQKPITQMTINEVLAWQDSIDAGYNSEAAGAYQFMEDTLRALVPQQGLTGNELFDAAMQDRLAVALMKERGLDDYLAGRITARQFGNELAEVWAALPVIGENTVAYTRTATVGRNAVSTEGLTDEALSTWQNFERIVGRSFDINSAHRSPEKNADVGGASKSEHIHGNAFDVDVRDVSIAERQALIVQARQAGFTGIGVYNNSLHFDVGGLRAWGPDFSSGTIPNWAKDALQTPAATRQNGQSVYDGVGTNRALTSEQNFLSLLMNPGSYRPLDDGARAGDIYSFPPGELRTDADSYQYKSGGDQDGVTDRLQFERQWDASAAVGIIVHERLDGIRYVADGHQRVGLANRLTAQGVDGIELQGFVYRESDGWSVSQVRAMAAIRNIRQESGTALDAAKIIRDHPELTASISRTRGFMSQAEGLSRLYPGPFKAMVNDVIPQNYGAIVGRIIPDDPEMQSVAIASLAKADPANVLQAESIVRDIRRMGLERQADENQGSLFGDGFDLGETAIGERAAVLDAAAKELRRDKTVFARLSRENERIEGAGNVLDAEANIGRERLAERALERLIILADQPGPIRDALDAAARSVRAGVRVGDAATDVIDAITGTDRPNGTGTVARGVDDDGFAPQAGQAADPIDDLPATGTAMAEPDLFGDPVESAGARAQVEQIETDLRARLKEDPASDIQIALARGDDAETAPLSTILADLDDEANFIEDLKFCTPKGLISG